MKLGSILLSLVCILVLCGCSSIPVTDPLDVDFTTNTQPHTTLLSTEPSGPLLVKDYIVDGFIDHAKLGISNYEVIIPEDGVLILTDKESLEKVFIDGDVYITYNADVSFHNVYVTGKVYCHGILRSSGQALYEAFAYYSSFYNGIWCSAYDGMHGQFIWPSGHGYGAAIGNEVLDHAFEKWGNYGPSAEQPELTVSQKAIEPQIVQHGDTTNYYSNVYIFTGNGLVADKLIEGDVYITSDAVIEFQNVKVCGNIYCYGQLKLSKNQRSYELNYDKYNKADAIYAYSFHQSCDTFDGIHGLVVGGPIICDEIVIADDALDYAFKTFGKQ